jgi:hypothetical protein
VNVREYGSESRGSESRGSESTCMYLGSGSPAAAPVYKRVIIELIGLL